MRIRACTNADNGELCNSQNESFLVDRFSHLRSTLVSENSDMTTNQNKAIVRRFFEAFNANDQNALKELLSPDLVAYSHGSPGPQNRETHLQGISMWNDAFETNFIVEEQIAEGDKVATRVNMRATHNRGNFQNLPPTGKQIEAVGVTIERIKDGKIIERRVSSDWYGMMQQLGLLPTPEQG